MRHDMQRSKPDNNLNSFLTIPKGELPILLKIAPEDNLETILLLGKEITFNRVVANAYATASDMEEYHGAMAGAVIGEFEFHRQDFHLLLANYHSIHGVFLCDLWNYPHFL